MLKETPLIESPCKLICQLDLTHGLCLGCGRSREEIARWTRYSSQERADIMQALPLRMQDLPEPSISTLDEALKPGS